MAIEDHPAFEKWSAALDALKDAKDKLQTAVVFGLPSDRINLLEGILRLAQERFNEASDEIGDA